MACLRFWTNLALCMIIKWIALHCSLRATTRISWRTFCIYVLQDQNSFTCVSQSKDVDFVTWTVTRQSCRRMEPPEIAVFALCLLRSIRCTQIMWPVTWSKDLAYTQVPGRAAAAGNPENRICAGVVSISCNFTCIKNRHRSSHNAANLPPASELFGAEGGPVPRAKAGTQA